MLRSPEASAASAASMSAAVSSTVSPISRAMKAVTRDSGKGAHEAVDRPSVLEGEHGGDRLDAHLARDLRMVVDIELDQPDRALRRAHGLFEDRRELPAGAAPGRPEIDQHRHFARGVDHVAHEVLGGGVLDEVGVGRRRAAGIQDGGIYAHAPCLPALLGGQSSTAKRLRSGDLPAKMGCPSAFGNSFRRLLRTDAQSASTRGSCPEASMKRKRSGVASLVVAVFSSGWQLTSAKSIRAWSTTTMTLPRRVVDQRERRHRASRYAEHGFEQLRACRS